MCRLISALLLSCLVCTTYAQDYTVFTNVNVLTMPVLSVGDGADLSFRSPCLADAFRVSSRVVSRKAVEDGRRYRFRFERELVLDTPELESPGV